MQAQMLAPAAVLVLWSLIMVYWLGAARFSAVKKVEPGALKAKRGVRGSALEGVIPDRANWPSHNYTNLMEQPTVFYPAVIILALVGASPTDLLLAWIYVGLRIVHSIWQSTVNKLPVRFVLFMLSSITLTILAVRAVMATLLADPAVVI